MEEYIDIKKCSQCGQNTSFERRKENESHEGKMSNCCDQWVCVDCVCWTQSDDSGLICKNCCECYPKDRNEKYK
jgi:hypothetical protein